MYIIGRDYLSKRRLFMMDDDLYLPLLLAFTLQAMHFVRVTNWTFVDYTYILSNVDVKRE